MYQRGLPLRMIVMMMITSLQKTGGRVIFFCIIHELRYFLRLALKMERVEQARYSKRVLAQGPVPAGGVSYPAAVAQLPAPFVCLLKNREENER